MKPAEKIIAYLDRTFKAELVREYKRENSLLIEEFDANFSVLVKIIEFQLNTFNKRLAKIIDLLEDPK